MLVLSRKENERILIGENIVITFIGHNKQGEARIGIEAPRDISIRRAELKRRPVDGARKNWYGFRE